MPIRRRRGLLALLASLMLVLAGAAIALAAAPHRRVRVGPGALPHRVCHARRAKAPRVRCHGRNVGKPGSGGARGSAPAAGTVTTPLAPPLEAPGVSAGPESPASETLPEPPALPHVQVSAVEYHYTLSRVSVPAGKVVFQFIDDGEDEHNLNVNSAEGVREATFADTAPKGVVNQTIVLKAGSYKLFCSLPGHEQKGMKATLTVE
jgi:plastocyanin